MTFVSILIKSVKAKQEVFLSYLSGPIYTFGKSNVISIFNISHAYKKYPYNVINYYNRDLNM